MIKYVVCGTSVEDVEAGVKAMKMAIESGATCGVGGSTVEEVEKNLDAMKQMVEGNTHTTEDCSHCPCPYYDCEDEDEDTSDYEDEDKDEADYCEGYMAMSDDYGEMSCCWDSPEDAMSDALNEGYDLDEIGIYKVRVYEDESVEVVDTIHHPIK